MSKRKPLEIEFEEQPAPPAEARESTYWICGECADARSWKCEGRSVTMMHGFCGWCWSAEQTTLIPVIDFSGPDGKRSIWD